MRRSTSLKASLAAAVAVGCLVPAVLLIGAAPAAVTASSTSTAHKCLVMTGSGDPAFTKNFNPYTATGLPSGTIVQGAFYEPLTITPLGGLPTRGWLARTWKWSRGAKTLTLNLVHNAKWSDGKPLTSTDVVYSLNAGKQDKIMDRVGLTGDDNNIASVKAKGKYGVAINLKTPDSQFISSTLNRQFVIPKHVWTKVKNPATYTNSKPVSSGPYNVIKRFTSQDYVLGKNPHYWKKGAPKIACLEYVQASSNDSALALIQNGQVDWTHNFVPNVEKAYEAKDKKHYHSFYATTAYPISLAPRHDEIPVQHRRVPKGAQPGDRSQDGLQARRVRLRTADRRARVARDLPAVGRARRSRPAQRAMAKYSPNAAKKMLTDAGFKYSGGKLIDPHGDRVKLDIHVISGWSDWVASNQIITRNLRDIGIDSNVALEPDWGAWQPSAYATKFPTLLWQGGSAGSPYGYFYANLSQNAFIPSGQSGERTGNWEHFSDAKATSLLSQWKGTLNPKKQQSIATKLQGIFLDKLPIVPLFIGPRWSTYSTKYFHCFNTPKNFYGDPIFTTFPDNILSFTRICPGGKAG